MQCMQLFGILRVGRAIHGVHPMRCHGHWRRLLTLRRYGAERMALSCLAHQVVMVRTRPGAAPLTRGQ